MEIVYKIINGNSLKKESTKARPFKKSLTTHTCKCCGSVIDFVGSGRKPVYCSDACKMKDYRTRKALRNSGFLIS